jgi:hypothetical protein
LLPEAGFSFPECSLAYLLLSAAYLLAFLLVSAVQVAAEAGFPDVVKVYIYIYIYIYINT